MKKMNSPDDCADENAARIEVSDFFLSNFVRTANALLYVQFLSRFGHGVGEK